MTWMSTIIYTRMIFRSSIIVNSYLEVLVETRIVYRKGAKHTPIGVEVVKVL